MANTIVTLEEIKKISYDDLAFLVYKQSKIDKDFCKNVEKLTLKGDQKMLIKSIQKDISSIRRGRKFIGYYEAFEYARKIGSIVDDIHMLVKDKQEAARLFKALILTDSKVFLRSDDSAGVIQESYHRAEDGWMECLEVMSDEEIHADIMEMLVCEGFGVRSIFSEKVPQNVLQKIYDEFYQRCKKESSCSFDDLQVMRLCAHYLKQPELYINASKLDKSTLNTTDLLNFAKEYRYADDAQGVLDMLKQVQEINKYNANEFYELQVWAYDMLKKEADATTAYKHWYEKTKSPSVLQAYLSRLEGATREKVRKEALKEAQQLSFGEALHFFRSMDEAALAAAYVMEHKHALETEYMYGGGFDKIVSWLQGDYPQEAILLYRDSCEKTLQKGQSKYYPWAIRALKKCVEIEKVNDTTAWSIEKNSSYMKQLLKKHERKRRFVELFFQSFDDMI